MIAEEKIMAELIEFAYEKMLKEMAYPFCAFVVKDGVVVSKGFNRSENPYMKKTDHGEMVAIRNACRALNRYTDLAEYDLYTTCEPCLACLDTAIWMKIKKVVYSIGKKEFAHYFNDHPYTALDYMRNNPDKLTVKADVLHDEGYQLFKTAKRKYGW